MTTADQQTTTGHAIMACHECDLLHQIERIPAGGKALCSRCGSLLQQNRGNNLNRTLALNLAALFCFILANTFPFLSMEIAGRSEETIFVSGVLSLWQLDWGALGMLVLMTSLLFPLLNTLAQLYLLLPLKLGIHPPGMATVYRIIRAIAPWCMLDVLLLSVLIAIAKLLDLAHIIPGISFYAFIALVLLTAAAWNSFDSRLLWPATSASSLPTATGPTAIARNWIHCHTCSLLTPDSNDIDHPRCPRCHSPLHQRKPDHMQRTWALIITAALLLIPANLYPIMTVIRFGKGESSTITGGIMHLIESGMWPLGMIVLVASIIIPVAKLLILAFLQLSVQKKSRWRLRDRALLYRYTELVGSWSMVDIFLIALLAGLVKLDALSTITPNAGALFFAGVVVTTIFAARSFDPRLIWDCGGQQH
ncbi:paraquat-inducible protein A [Mariprofundus erugo]|uniref:Paraquat-inducible protein A n=1 Tax=Mariprofundus erugo TaxID=2528639 RepID=A0A5R9GRY5_9PROT|nr:paraquat-inducible protein A [Mariprofundus erugo]TLS69001.1 paraquat-inducible protein A [Mariprofundus erugo]